MAIRTFCRKTEDNLPMATALLEEGDGLLAAGEELKALDCYIRAADMVRSIPVTYSRKAVELALACIDDPLGIENRRIAGCFELLSHDVGDGGDEGIETVMKRFEEIFDTWRSFNIAPQQHLILSGEGGKTYLLELVWNEGGELDASVRDIPGIRETVMAYLARGPVYAVTLDTLYGWRPFEMHPMLSSDDEIRAALPYFARGGISYVSPRLRPIILELLEMRGKKCNDTEFPRLPFIPATMNWYDNCGYLGNGIGRLEGLPE